MSRRSLRLDDGLLDRGLPLSSASFSVGGGWRSCRPWQSRRPGQLSVSCSESVLDRTPRKARDASLHGAESDASLLSSLLDESSIRETTLVDALWGLDRDQDPKESTVLADTALTTADVLGNPVQSLSHVSGRGHEADGRGRDSGGSPRTPTIYCRDRGRSRTGVPSGPRAVLRCLRGALTHAWRLCRALGSKVVEATRRSPDRRGGLGPRHEPLAAMSIARSGRDPTEPRPDAALCKMAGGVLGLSRGCPTTAVLGVNRLVLLGLVPLLLFIGLSWFGPPALSLSEWRTASPESPAEGGVLEERRGPTEEEVAGGGGGLLRVERFLAALRGRVEAGGRRARQSHDRLLRLHAGLRLRLRDRPGRSPERRLARIEGRLDRDRLRGEQVHRRHLEERRSHGSRLERLERNLRTLAARTQEAKRRPDAPPEPQHAALSVSMDRRSHDALLQKVAELQASLEEVRKEVEEPSGPDRLREMVHREVEQQLSVQRPAALLQRQYVSRTGLRGALSSLELRILRNVSARPERRRGREAEPGGVGEEDVRTIVRNALKHFSQDRTGMADYALESGGGSVLSTRCSETHQTQAALLSLFGVPLWFFSQSPRTVIQPDVHPGNCWAFRGSRGFLVIRLSMKIHVSAVSVEHIPRALAPSGTLRSAPRDFSVYGLDGVEQEPGTALGSFTFQEDGEALQTFPVGEPDGKPFQIIEVQVLSNWGHQEYTCLYRLRVHGTPGAA